MTVKADTSMTIRMNSTVKQQAQEIFSELGLDMTTAINVFLRQAIRSKGFPFEVRLSEPNAETIEALEEVKAMKEDPSRGKSYADVDEMMSELLA